MVHAEQLDGSVLATLCEEPGPWSVEELMRAHGGSPAVKTPWGVSVTAAWSASWRTAP
jgi:hypothetical protein